MISRPTLTRALQRWWPHRRSTAASDPTLVTQIRDAAAQLRNESDPQLAQRAAQIRQRIGARYSDRKSGVPVFGDDLIRDVFALVYEATRRVLEIELYDVQLLAGLALVRGQIAEMQTGEGKTFTALLPAAAFGLAGRGVHVMTVNAYLAGRDFELLAPVFGLLNLSVGLVDADIPPAQKRQAYASDVTFGPGYEFGFDYLRDQVTLLANRESQRGRGFRQRLHGQSRPSPQILQRGHAAAILDEADSVMIDEAITPLIIASGGKDPALNADAFRSARAAAQSLVRDEDYFLDESARQVRLSDAARRQLTIDPRSRSSFALDRPWAKYVEQALYADHFLDMNVDYVLTDGEVQIVDQYTGRIFEDRTWRDGLQQAVQAKEGVLITTESKSVARITRQRYFRLYDHICGMTGTATGSDAELRDVYEAEVVVIPTHKPCQRQMLPLRLFASTESKERAICEEIVRLHNQRRPVLVGTATIESSQQLAQRLRQAGLQFQLLNGRQDAEESQIVAQAGQAGVITIATNMAGRGTDIKLGPGVAESGGLHVIAAELQESARVDRQLIGRSARQGDPGSCQQFAAGTDRLFARHAPHFIHLIEDRADVSGEVVVSDSLRQEIGRIQSAVEKAQTEHRQQLFAHDDWLDNTLDLLIGPATD